MRIQDAIKHFGSQRLLAKALGITEGAVSQWVKSGLIPHSRAYQLQVITGGKLQANSPGRLVNRSAK